MLRITLLALFAVIAVPACSTAEGRTLPQGEISLCLHGEPDPGGPDGGMQDHTWTATGEVVSDADADGQSFDTVGCTSAPSRVLSVTDSAGTNWQIGYAARLDGSDRTPALAVAPGDTVSFSFVREVVWGVDNGLVVRDADGALLLAAQEGWMTDLQTADGDPLGSLSITVEGTSGPRVRSECGMTQGADLRFVADDDVLLATGEQGEVTVDGHLMQALNVASFSYVDDAITCTDTWGPTRFVVWRGPS